MTKSLVILVDGSYYIYSVYYAFPKLVNSFNEPTWVVYGVINILRSIYIKYKPTHMVVIFDSYGNTFRNDLFKEYKLNRPPMPIDLKIQIPIIYKIVKAMGFSLMVISDVEADDVIGTLSVFFLKALDSCYIYIFSGDKDMMQLVNSSIYVMNTRFNKLFTISEVRKKFGIPPNLMIDYLSLLGDISDNVPGVPGIGKVTAQFLLQRFSGLNVLYRNLDKVSTLIGLKRAKSISLKLEKYRSLAFLSYKLVTIRKDLVLEQVLYDDFLIKSLDIDMLMFLFDYCDFKKWLKSLRSGNWIKVL